MLAHQGLGVKCAAAPHPGPNRRVAVLASSGLLLTMVATSATAVEQAAPASAEASGVSISDAARTALAISPIVRVPTPVVSPMR